MEKADILVFLISQDFIASSECMREWDWAKSTINNDRVVFRIPIILENCAWLRLLNDDGIKALPNDGKPISSYKNSATAWQEVFEGILTVIDELRSNFLPRQSYIRDLEKTDFISEKQIRLQDIYMFPRLTTYAPQSGKVKLSDEIVKTENELLAKDYVIVHGPEMSGKTALGRNLYFHLIEKNVPVLYVDLAQISGNNFERILIEEYKKQFDGDYIIWKNQRDKTLIVDNLGGVGRGVEIVVFAMKIFSKIVVTLPSDVYISFYRDDSRLVDFFEMKIEPLNHSEQERLIRRRLALTEAKKPVTDGLVDQIEDRVNSIIISNKIVPRYPFYVLSILQTYESFMPDDLSISSFGHCYHALIVAKLIKAGISQKDSDLNACFNFAEKLSYRIFLEDQKDGWSGSDNFSKFVSEYMNDFIISDAILNRLRDEYFGLIDGGGNFCAKYIYYFFLGRYFAREQKLHKREVAKLCEESHIGTNKLILFFIIHHSTDHTIIDDILLSVMCSINGVEPAVLDSKECNRFYDIFAAVPKYILTADRVEVNRRKERQTRDHVSEEKEKDERSVKGSASERIRDIYRVFKCNQILGQILRNKFGSMDRGKIEEIVETIADGGLRLVNSILSEESEMERVAIYIAEKHPQLESNKIEEMIRFFSFIWTMDNVERVVEAINVPEIREVVMEVVRRKSTPAYDLIGYFNLLDNGEELSAQTKEELKALLKRHRYQFMYNVLSFRTQNYMNTHVRKSTIEQAICSVLKIKYTYRKREV